MPVDPFPPTTPASEQLLPRRTHRPLLVSPRLALPMSYTTVLPEHTSLYRSDHVPPSPTFSAHSHVPHYIPTQSPLSTKQMLADFRVFPTWRATSRCEVKSLEARPSLQRVCSTACMHACTRPAMPLRTKKLSITSSAVLLLTGLCSSAPAERRRPHHSSRNQHTCMRERKTWRSRHRQQRQA